MKNCLKCQNLNIDDKKRMRYNIRIPNKCIYYQTRLGKKEPLLSGGYYINPCKQCKNDNYINYNLNK